MILNTVIKKIPLQNINKLITNPIISNFGWSVSGSLGAKIISPIFSILVARMLGPNVYGFFGITMALMAFIDLIKDLGLSQAVIVDHQKEDLLSLQFTIQGIFAFFLYAAIFFVSPIVADYYKVAELKVILRLIGRGAWKRLDNGVLLSDL